MADKMMTVTTLCSACGAETKLTLPEKNYTNYINGDLPVQVCFPKENVFVRENLISGLCFDCQSRIFHRPKPGQEAAWGKLLGNCTCCDRPVYECDIVDGKFVCEDCGNTEYYK